MYTQIFNAWFFVSLAIFVIISLIHLVRCFQEKDGLADISKFMLMPALLLVFLSCSFSENVSFSIFNVLGIIAIVFSFAGDLALVFDREKRFFALGILCFSIVQISYIIISIIKFNNVEFPFLISFILLLFYLVGFVIFLLGIKKFLHGMTFMMVIYTFLLVLMSWLFLSFAIAIPTVASILAAIGGVIFIISDSMLATQYFMGGIFKSRFFIMLSYIIAQFLIVMGIIGSFLIS